MSKTILGPSCVTSICLDFRLTVRNGSILDFRTPEECKEMKLLPSIHTNNVMIANYKILFARVLVDYLPAFKMFSKIVRRHIKHPLSEKMKEKSTVVSFHSNLGLL